MMEYTHFNADVFYEYENLIFCQPSVNQQSRHSVSFQLEDGQYFLVVSKPNAVRHSLWSVKLTVLTATMIIPLAALVHEANI